MPQVAQLGPCARASDLVASFTTPMQNLNEPARPAQASQKAHAGAHGQVQLSRYHRRASRDVGRRLRQAVSGGTRPPRALADRSSPRALGLSARTGGRRASKVRRRALMKDQEKRREASQAMTESSKKTKQLLAERIVAKLPDLLAGSMSRRKRRPPPFYCSIDLRDSGHKIVRSATACTRASIISAPRICARHRPCFAIISPTFIKIRQSGRS